MKTKNLDKVQEMVNTQVTNSLKELTSKKSNKKVKAEKKEEPKAKSSKKEKVVKEVAERQKVSILEEVISTREVKYIYPDDIQNTLDRKKWRQRTRNELRKLEREMLRISDQSSKEYLAAKKKYEAFQKTVLKVDEAV